ncbi:MAG: DUF3352 domain-containing protein [Prochloraceae cyanobacterium]|nr:DUF3352 domain-containing protein [Prochloraceae cyanobacterium]
MSKKNYKKGILVVVGTLAIIGAGGTYLWTRTIIGKELTPTEAASMVPEKAWMATYISTNSKSWSKLTEFGSYKAKDLLHEELDDLSSQLSDNNINYHKDIKPWLGSMMIAKFPPNEGKSMTNPESLNLLAVIGIKNKLEAGMFIEKLKGVINPSYFLKRTYKGVLILETKTKTNELLNTALIEDRLIMASNPRTMNLAIDTIQGEPSFADKIEPQKIITKNLGQERTLIQIYIPDFVSVMKTSLRSSPQTRLATRTVEKINDIEAIMMEVAVNERGLHFQTIAKLNSSANRPEIRGLSDELLPHLPDSTIALIKAGSIKRSWSSFLATAAKDRILKFNLNKYKNSFESKMEVDLERDVFSWMDGEFALAIIPTNRGILADYGLAGRAMWTTTQRSQAEKALKKLEEKVEYFGEVLVKKRVLNGKEITEWITFQGEDILSYSWLNDSCLMLTFGNPPDSNIDINFNNSLSKDQSFTTVTSYLPKNNKGYFYLNNLDIIIPIIERLFEKTSYSIIPEARAALTSVESIALTTSNPLPFFSQLDIMVSLKSEERN